MCGRFSIVKDVEELEKRFNIKVDRDSYRKNTNASPTQTLPVITNVNPEEASFYKWGLVPFWAKDIKIGSSLFNARSETILDKPAFRRAIQNQRCLVIANSFYEWKKLEKSKIQYEISIKENDLFCMAGIWDRWKGEQGNALYTFSIITTEANDLMTDIHDRMPVILPPDIEKEWLRPDIDLSVFLTPFPSELMKAEVYKELNSLKDFESNENLLF